MIFVADKNQYSFGIALIIKTWIIKAERVGNSTSTWKVLFQSQPCIVLSAECHQNAKYFDLLQTDVGIGLWNENTAKSTLSPILCDALLSWRWHNIYIFNWFLPFTFVCEISYLTDRGPAKIEWSSAKYRFLRVTSYVQ